VNSKIVGTGMSNHKEMPKVLFSKKVIKGEKLMTHRDQLLAIK
jgi:hypothetical protein